MSDRYDIICIGAGPTGLATAIEAVRAGMKALVIDKGSLCNSIFHYPANMVFFTTPELSGNRRSAPHQPFGEANACRSA